MIDVQTREILSEVCSEWLITRAPVKSDWQDLETSRDFEYSNDHRQTIEELVEGGYLTSEKSYKEQWGEKPDDFDRHHLEVAPTAKAFRALWAPR